ncbi:MAG: glutamine--fructose-6-phosphate transaminase (isomerizing) [Clostridiales bacterium]|nr:glutamine--fructose-6-phosphate transaminase (isomerizing) [Clostridiales bacterium]
MCGIVGFTGARQAGPILLEGLRRLEYRGYDSAGVAVQDDGGQIRAVKASGRLEHLCTMTREGAAVPGTCGIGHTRWATHGAPTTMNAHPHLSNDGRFAIVHNGIIENYAELREELKARGFVFHSETDTEVVVHLLDMYYDGDLKKAVIRTTARLEGSYSLGVLCAEKPGELIAVKCASPLVLGVGAGENFFASDITALLPYTRTVVELEDGEFADLTPEGMRFFDSAGKEIQKMPTRVVWSMEAAEKGGYEHFMLKEIMEQPRALKATIEPRIREGRIQLEGFALTKEELQGIRRVVITACGSAYHAGCVGRYVMEELTRIPVEVDIASELRYRHPIIDEHTLVIVISQSGETADTIAALKECKNLGARTLAIVNVVGSTVAKLAHSVLYTWAGPEIAVATTKGYTTQLAVLTLLAVYMAGELGRLDETRYAQLVEGIAALPERSQRAIDLNRRMETLAQKYHSTDSLFFIGRNLDYAVAMEASLKLKEISYIHSEAYAAGELKHGTIALIDQGRLVVALACHTALFDKLMSNVKEVKARGARVLGVVQEGEHRIFAEADDALLVPQTDPLLLPIPEIIPLQLFAYYVAKANGCDIDKPKNLAKSVTVE